MAGCCSPTCRSATFALYDGEGDMMVMWNARASELQQQGHPVDLVWHGATITTTMWGSRSSGSGLSGVRLNGL